MSNVWHPKDITLKAGQVVSASLSNVAVSDEFTITAGGAKCMAIVLDASAATGTVEMKLQTTIGGSGVWLDSKVASVTGSGRFYITLMSEKAADQTYLPLLSRGRVVVTTDGGEDITVAAVTLLQQV